MRKIKLGKRARNYTGYSALVDNKDFLELYQYASKSIMKALFQMALVLFRVR